jgi:Predicted integral membrane protein
MAKTLHPIPAHVAPLPKAVDHNRHLPASAAFRWLALGWRDLWTRPLPSLLYGLGVALLSLLVIAAMVNFGWAQILFPALSGFLVVGPLLATGLYEKSRRLEAGEPVSLWRMLFPGRGAGAHLLFVGAILLTLMLVWMRAAVLLYALFFGWRPFPGFDHIVTMLFTTPVGLTMLVTGTAIGGLFAAFSFAISAFSIPMLLDRKLDAFSAMAMSMSLVWNNLPAALLWGAIILLLTLLSLGTALIGLIIIFPLLGHATWHAYAAMRDEK